MTILQMKVQTVNDPLQCQRVSTKPMNIFCFDFGEIHSGSDASRGPSEVKYSAKVHVRSALCHLFGVRGARNCSCYLFYAESVT